MTQELTDNGERNVIPDSNRGKTVSQIMHPDIGQCDALALYPPNGIFVVGVMGFTDTAFEQARLRSFG